MVNENLDITFGQDGVIVVDFPGVSLIEDVAVYQDGPHRGKVVVVGTIDNGRRGNDIAVLRYGLDGQLDNTFGNGGIVKLDFFGEDDEGTRLEIDSDNNIIVAGSAQKSSREYDFALARLDETGQYDESFGDSGKVTADFRNINRRGNRTDASTLNRVKWGIARTRASNDELVDIALYPDGRIVALGKRTVNTDTDEVALVRYTSDGQIDPTFGGRGVNVPLSYYTNTTTSITRPQKGRLSLIDGKAVIPYLVEAEFESQLARNARDLEPTAITLDASGNNSIIISGSTNWNGGNQNPSSFPVSLLGKLNDNGGLDTSFGGDGSFSDVPGLATTNRNSAGNSDVEVLPDGKILAVSGSRLQQYDSEGYSRNTFGSSNISISDFAFVPGNEDLIAVGTSFNDFAVEKLADDGTVEQQLGGINDSIENLTQANAQNISLLDDQIIVSGGARIDGDLRWVIARYGDRPNQIPTNIQADESISRTVSVGENQGINAEVAKFNVIDPDKLDTHSLSLVAGEGDEDNNLFFFDGDILRTRQDFDFENSIDSYNIRIQANDGNGGITQKSFIVDITDLNDVPTAFDDEVQTTISRSRTFINARTLLANDEDEDLPNNVLSILPFGGISNVVNARNVTYNFFSGQIEFEPDNVGEASFDYTILDGKGGSSTATVTVTVFGDQDNDGVGDEVEDAAPNGGDGNFDGILDKNQPHVASLPNSIDGSYITLASPPATSLLEVTATENPSAGSAPGVLFPVGFLNFGLFGFTTGASVDVNVFLENEVSFNTFYKYGPTPNVEEPYWFEFLDDGTTGAKFSNDFKRFTLQFVDGDRGDLDVAPNGLIIDPGAPGINQSAGSLDPNFGNGGKVTTDFTGGEDMGFDLVLQPDGKFIVVGTATNINGLEVLSFAKYNPDGSLDTVFGTGGRVISDISYSTEESHRIALQSDGKLIVASPGSVRRFGSDGSLDTSFGFNGARALGFDAADVVIQPDGKIVVSGVRRRTDSGFAVARLNIDGSFDISFGDNGKVFSDFGAGELANTVAIQSDGKIVAAGYNFRERNDADFAILRLNIDGSVDDTFGNAGQVTTDVSGFFNNAFGITIQADDKIVAVGQSGTIQNYDFGIARYNSDGSLDTEFGDSGKITTDLGGARDRARDVIVQSDGKIFVVGQGGFGDFAVARYDRDGNLDNSFGEEGTLLTDFQAGSDDAISSVLQPDGKILVAGRAFTDNDFDFSLARYLGETFNLSPLSIIDISLQNWSPDQEGNVSFRDIFVDPDGDSLNYSATLENGDPLPDWLGFSFDAEENSFTFTDLGTPNNFPKFNIKIVSTDPRGATAQQIIPIQATGSGFVIDNYIAGATVFFDADKNGILSGGEPFTNTDETGAFQLTVPNTLDANNNGRFDPTDGQFVAFGGIDILTGLPLETPVTATPDATVVTLLTTLVADLVEQGLSVEAANILVRSSLSIPDSVYLNTFDPIVATKNAEVGGLETYAAMVKTQNLVTQVAALLSGATGLSIANNTRAIVTAIVDELQQTGSLDLSSENQLATIIQLAADKANADVTGKISALAQVIVEVNQTVDTVFVNTPPINLEEELAKIQKVALDQTKSDLIEVGAGNKATEELLAENTGAGLITKINNIAPTDIVISQQEIAEELAFAALVGNLSTIDLNPNDTHSYSLIAGEGDTDNDAFEIVGNAVITKESLDFETKNSYSIRVQSVDDSGGSLEETLTIGVSDVIEAEVYSSFTDSPFNDVSQTLDYFFLEDFEDGQLNTRGVSSSGGQVFSPSSTTDSVDSDDGIVDGLGKDGYSYGAAPSDAVGVTFSFDENLLGQLPTHAGIVFTDSSDNQSDTFSTITFLDSSEREIAIFSPLTDTLDREGETSEDRFVGLVHAEGIAAIRVTGTAQTFEVDHLQYGGNTIDLVATAFDVTNDHVLNGKADISFTIENRGSTAPKQPFSIDVVYSDDDIIGNEDDLFISDYTITPSEEDAATFAAGNSISDTLTVDLPLDLLNSRAQIDDILNQGSGYLSSSYDYLGIVVDPDNVITEIDDLNNFNQGNSIDKDDITYFPWDIDGNGLVTPTDAIFVINRLGQSSEESDPLADFDGNGVITPTDAIAAINRVGYSINSSVFE